jgi:hypothetical protein
VNKGAGHPCSEERCITDKESSCRWVSGVARGSIPGEAVPLRGVAPEPSSGCSGRSPSRGFASDDRSRRWRVVTSLSVLPTLGRSRPDGAGQQLAPRQRRCPPSCRTSPLDPRTGCCAERCRFIRAHSCPPSVRRRSSGPSSDPCRLRRVWTDRSSTSGFRATSDTGSGRVPAVRSLMSGAPAGNQVELLRLRGECLRNRESRSGWRRSRLALCGTPHAATAQSPMSTRTWAAAQRPRLGRW